MTILRKRQKGTSAILITILALAATVFLCVCREEPSAQPSPEEEASVESTHTRTNTTPDTTLEEGTGIGSPDEKAPPPVSIENVPPDAPDPKRLLKRFDELYESSGTFSQIEIEIVTPRKTRTMSVRAWSKGEDTALLLIDAPARDAGMATLRVGKNLWNYLPKISRTIRVPPSMMMGSWMGSDFTNDDLVRESSYEEDYTSRLLELSTDPPGWKVRLEARPDMVGLWEQVDIVFSRDTELPVELQYFDRKGRLSRTMHLEEVKSFGGRLIPTVITIVPEREEGRHTKLRYTHVEFGVKLDDSMFSLSELERKR